MIYFCVLFLKYSHYYSFIQVWRWLFNNYYESFSNYSETNRRDKVCTRSLFLTKDILSGKIWHLIFLVNFVFLYSFCSLSINTFLRIEVILHYIRCIHLAEAFILCHSNPQSQVWSKTFGYKVKGCRAEFPPFDSIQV